jgi:hypothetical protein
MSTCNKQKELRQGRIQNTYIESFTLSLEEHICKPKIIGLAVGLPKLSAEVVEHTQPDHHKGGRQDTIEVPRIHGDLGKPEDERMKRPRSGWVRRGADKGAEALIGVGEEWTRWLGRSGLTAPFGGAVALSVSPDPRLVFNSPDLVLSIALSTALVLRYSPL